MSEDLQSIPEIELLIYDARRITLDSVMCEFSLFLIQERTPLGRKWQIPKGEEGKGHGTTAFNKEKISPVRERTGMNLEDAESKKAAKGGGD
jgi:hypothetical protein